MARDQPRPPICPAAAWCDKGNYPCYCENAPAPINPTPTPLGPSPGNR